MKKIWTKIIYSPHIYVSLHLRFQPYRRHIIHLILFLCRTFSFKFVANWSRFRYNPDIYVSLSSGCSSLTDYAFDFQSATLAFPNLFVFNFVIFVVVLYWFKTDISGVLKYNHQQTKRKSFLLLWFLKFLNQPKSDDVFPSLPGRHKTKTNQHFVKQKCAITFEADV